MPKIKTAKNDKANRKAENQKALNKEASHAHWESIGAEKEPSYKKRRAAEKSAYEQRDKATAISSARPAARAAAKSPKTAGAAKKAEAQKKLSAQAKKAHLTSNASLAALPNKIAASNAAAKATAVSSARGAKIAAAKAKSGGMVEVNMSNGTTYYRKKPSK